MAANDNGALHNWPGDHRHLAIIWVLRASDIAGSGPAKHRLLDCARSVGTVPPTWPIRLGAKPFQGDDMSWEYQSSLPYGECSTCGCPPQRSEWHGRTTPCKSGVVAHPRSARPHRIPASSTSSGPVQAHSVADRPYYNRGSSRRLISTRNTWPRMAGCSWLDSYRPISTGTRVHSLGRIIRLRRHRVRLFLPKWCRCKMPGGWGACCGAAQ